MKLVHAADLHIDSPLKGLGAHDGAPVERVREATRKAFRNLIDLCLKEEATALLLAGDVFDGEWKDFSTGLYFVKELERLRPMPVFLVRGNHDAASEVTRHLRLPPHVHEFSEDKAETRVVGELAVHGLSFPRRVVTESLVPQYPAPLPGHFNVGLLHTSCDGRVGHAPYAPCRVEELVQKGYDYWALGHVHAYEVLHQRPWIVFPGNTQGRHIRETGVKGCVVVTVEGREARLRRVPLDVVRWKLIELALAENDDLEILYARARAAFDAARLEAEGRLCAVRLSVSGACRAHLQITDERQKIENELRALTFEWQDEVWLEAIKLHTRPPLKLEELRKAPGFLGELLRQPADEIPAALKPLVEKFGAELKEAGLDLSDPNVVAELHADAEALLGIAVDAVKIVSLKLERFGHFQGAALEFSDGLQLVHGRNEAGKSTLLAALRALLFKYPPGQYDFRFPDATLAIWARLQFSDGAQAEVRREKNKGWKGMLGAEKFSDEQLKEKLGRPSEELFKNVFAFGLGELARGAESIKDAGLSAAISGASVGVGMGPDALAAELKKQADELFADRATKKPINQLAADIRERLKKLRELELHGDQFRALEEALAKEKARATELRGGRESLLKRTNLVDTALRALPAKEALAGARLALAGLGPVTPLPASAESEYLRLKADRDRLAARLADLDGKFAREKSELDSLAELPAEPPDARLAQLSETWSGHLERKEQLEAARAERERLTHEKARLRARLDPPWSSGEGPLPVPRVEEIRRHKSLLDGLSRKQEAAVRDRDRAARELSEAREQAAQMAGEAPSPDGLARLRAERDGLWERVRKSWLEGALTGGEASGELFRHSGERQMAASYLAAVNAADQYADELRRRATDVAAAAEAAARRDDRARAQENFELELKTAAAALGEGERNWQALWERCGFLPHSPDAMMEWLGDYHTLTESEAQLQAAADRCQRLETATGEYEAALRAAVGGDGAADKLHGEARRRLKAESEREQQRIRTSERRRNLTRTSEELAQERKQTHAALEALRSELAAWRTRAGAADDDAFLAAASAAREAHDLGKEIKQHERTLAEAHAGAADLDEALARGRELLSAEKAEFAGLRARLESELQETDRKVGAAEAALRPLDGSSQSLAQLALLETKRAELRDRAGEWARLTVARSLLERQMARFSEKEQPRLLESVGKLFSAMTRARYPRVYQRLDAERTFVAVRADGVEVEPAALSTGTREQLYLAVRLAYIDSYCTRSEPLPLLLDDVLVNFDDERAAATLDVLSRFAAEGRTQVMLLTCHAHLVELAKRVLPSLKPAELPPSG